MEAKINKNKRGIIKFRNQFLMDIPESSEA